MKNITIQTAASILIENGRTFRPTQPIVENGKFIEQYLVDGSPMTGSEVIELIKTL